MPPRIVFSDVRGRYGELRGGTESIDDKVEIVKLTTGTFIKEQKSDIWVEVVLANDSGEDIMITELDMQVYISISDFSSGESTRISQFDTESAPPYYESDTMPSHPSVNNGNADGWNSMYKNSVLLGKEEPYFEKGSIGDSVKVFLHTVDSDTFAQRIITVPVSFELVSGDGPKFTCKNFNTVSQRGEPVLFPKEEIRQQISQNNEEYDEYVDGISFWVRFSTNDIPAYGGDGKFIFELETKSELGPIRHTYHYYILPKGGSFNDSLKTPEVDYWSPADSRKMFEQWADEYDVEKATQTGTGTDREMIRNVEGVRDEASIKTKGDYKIDLVKRIDEAVRGYLNTVLAIVGALAISNLARQGQFSTLWATIIVVIAALFIILIINVFLRKPITIYLWHLIRRL